MLKCGIERVSKVQFVRCVQSLTPLSSSNLHIVTFGARESKEALQDTPALAVSVDALCSRRTSAIAMWPPATAWESAVTLSQDSRSTLIPPSSSA